MIQYQTIMRNKGQNAIFKRVKLAYKFYYSNIITELQKIPE